MLTVIPATEQKEYTPAMPIYDVRSYDAEAPTGIHTFGGFLGELLISLHCLNENLTAKGENPSFEMTAESIMQFMKELLEDGYPQGICSLKLTSDLLTEPEKAEEPESRKLAIAAKRLADGHKISQYGTKFLLQTMPGNFISRDIMQDVMQAICMIHYHEPQEVQPVPAEDDESVAEEQRDKIIEQNEEIEKSNELYAKLK